MKQKKAIENVQLSFACPQDWDNMATCAGGRFCTVCQKVVYDFTNKSQKDYDRMLKQQNGKMCGRFQPAQLNPTATLAKAAALAALSFMPACTNAQIPAPPPPPVIGEIEVPKTLGKDDVYTIVEQNPEFEGGVKAMFKFIKDSLQYPQVAKENEIEGTVYVGFVVEKDGRLTEINIKRGISGGCNEEAARLINLLSGKWKAGKSKGVPVRVRYVLPINFKLDE